MSRNRYADHTNDRTRATSWWHSQWLPRATVAIILASAFVVSMVPRVPAAEPDEINAVITDGIDWLLDRQNPNNGSWYYGDAANTAMAAMCMLSWGYAPDDPRVASALQYIMDNVDPVWIRSTYYTSIAILPLAAAYRVTPDQAYFDAITGMRDWLIQLQWDEDSLYGNVAPSTSYYGGFGYGNGGRADLSNTQWAIMGLYEADEVLGLDADETDQTYQKALTFLDRCRNGDGGSGYTPGSNSILTMTSASVWSYSLCGVENTDPRVSDGLQWLADHYSMTNNDGWGWWSEYYYKVTFGKAMILSQQTRLGTQGYDWFADLSDALVSEQNDDGSWPNTGMNGAEMSTAWAIMALQTGALSPDVEAGMIIRLASHADVHVYDPTGQHMGINYDTDPPTLDEEILGATFTYEDANGQPQPFPADGTIPDDWVQIVSLPVSQAGAYRIELVGTSDGDYELTVQGLQDGAVVATKTYTGTIAEDEHLGATATVTAIAGAVTLLYSDDNDNLAVLPVMQVTPKKLILSANPDTVEQIAVTVSEVGGQETLHNVTFYATDMTGIDNTDVTFDANHFDLAPGTQLVVNVSVPIPADPALASLVSGLIVVESADGGAKNLRLETFTATVTSSVDSPTNAAVIPFTITFNADATGFEQADIQITNGTGKNFAPTTPNRVWEIDVTPTSDGEVTVTVPEGAATEPDGKANAEGTLTIVSDRTAPTVAVISTSPQNADLISFTIAANEDLQEITENTLSVTNGTIVSLLTTVEGADYDGPKGFLVKVRPTADGNVTLTVPAGAVSDIAGNTNAAAASATAVSDRTRPVPILSVGSSRADAIPVTVTFTETVSGFDAGDVMLTAATDGNFAEITAGTTYTLDATPAGDLPIRVRIPANVATDDAGNGNAEAIMFVDADGATGLVITAQPESVLAELGDDVSFTVAAAGDDPIDYQWRENGVPISGATGASLDLSDITADDAGWYACLVSNDKGAILSVAAMLKLAERERAELTVLPAERADDGYAALICDDGAWMTDGQPYDVLVGEWYGIRSFAADGKAFDKWTTSGGATVEDPDSAVTRVKAATQGEVTATFKDAEAVEQVALTVEAKDDAGQAVFVDGSGTEQTAGDVDPGTWYQVRATGLPQEGAMLEGTEDLSAGHAWGDDDADESFTVNVNGRWTVEFVFDESFSTLGQIINDLNDVFDEENIWGIEAYDAGDGHLGLRGLVDSPDQTIELTAGPEGKDALATLGLMASTYTGTPGTEFVAWSADPASAVEFDDDSATPASAKLGAEATITATFEDEEAPTPVDVTMAPVDVDDTDANEAVLVLGGQERTGGPHRTYAGNVYQIRAYPAAAKPADAVGTVDITGGIDWSTESDTFSVSVNGEEAVNVTLNVDASGNSGSVENAITDALNTAGVVGLQTYRDDDDSETYIGLRTTAAGADQTFTIAAAGRGSALATLGLAAGTYTGTPDYEFVGWSADPADAALFDELDADDTTVDLFADATITATFQPAVDAETVDLVTQWNDLQGDTTSPAGTSISPGVLEGAPLKDTWYRFEAWGHTPAKAHHVGAVDLSDGHDWEAQPDEFNIALGDDAPVTVTLDQTAADLGEVVTAINTALSAAGIDWWEASASSTFGKYVAISAHNTGLSLTLADSGTRGSALSTLGMSAGTYEPQDFEFVKWEIDPTDAGEIDPIAGNSDQTSIKLSKDATVTAVFAPVVADETYELALAADTAQGDADLCQGWTWQGTGTYTAGDEWIQLRATPLTPGHAAHMGTADMGEGHDWGTTADSFMIAVNGGEDTEVVLDVTTASLEETRVAIDTALATAGVGSVQAYTMAAKYVGIRTSATGVDQTFTLSAAARGSALAAIGWTAGTYTGADYEFTGWQADPSSAAEFDFPNEPNASVRLTADAAIMPVFSAIPEPETVELTMVADPEEGGAATYDDNGTPATQGNVPKDEWVVIEAVPASNDYEFAGWEAGTGAELAGGDLLANPTSVRLTADATVTATFAEVEVVEPTTYALAVEGNPEGGGAPRYVDGAEQISGTVEAEVWYEVRANPEPGYTFTHWSITPDAIVFEDEDPLRPVTSIQVTADAVLRANYEPVTAMAEAELTMAVMPEETPTRQPGEARFHDAGAGTWYDQQAGMQAAPAGLWIMIIADADDGFEFDHWSIDPEESVAIEDSMSDTTSIKIAPDAVATVTAVFEPVEDASVEVDLAVSHLPQTTAEAGDARLVDSDTQVTSWQGNSPFDATPATWHLLQAYPDAGYRFTGWDLDPADAGTIEDPTQARTSVRLTKDARLVANFEEAETTTLTLAMVPEETPTTDPGNLNPGVGEFEVPVGEWFQIQANPAGGFEFVSWAVTEETATIDRPDSASTWVLLEEPATVTATLAVEDGPELTLAVTPEATPTRDAGDVEYCTNVWPAPQYWWQTWENQDGGPYAVNADDWHQLRALPNAPGYRFVSWQADAAGSVEIMDPTDQSTWFRLLDDVTITGVFEPDPDAEDVMLTMAVNPDAPTYTGGTAVFNTWATEGDVTIDTWTRVDATAVAGFEFAGWTVAPSSAGIIEDKDEAITSVKLTDDATVTATFAPITAETAELTMAVAPEPTPTRMAGEAEVDAGGFVTFAEVEVGEWLMIQATPAADFEFTGWTASPKADVVFEEGGQERALTSIKITGDATVTATFEAIPVEDPVMVQLAVLPGETPTTDAGDAKIHTVGWFDQDAGPLTLETGRWYEIQADAGPGYQFAAWQTVPGADVVVEDPEAEHTSAKFGEDLVLTALFAPADAAEFEVVVSPEETPTFEPGDADIDGLGDEGMVDIGEEYVISADPAEGYAFDHWEADPTAAVSFADSTEDTTFTVFTGDAVITAVFVEADTVTLTMALDPEPTPTRQAAGITPLPGDHIVPASEWFDLEATPDVGYQFSAWVIAPAENGTIADVNAMETQATLTGDATITATLTPLPTAEIAMGTNPETSPEAQPGGAAYDTGWQWQTAGTVNQDQWYRIVAMPAVGYRFTGWSAEPAENAVFEDADDRTTSVKLSDDAAIIANFEDLGGQEIDVTMAVSPEETATTFPGDTEITINGFWYDQNDGAQAARAGTWYRIEADPDWGQTFVGWQATPSSAAEFEEADAETTSVRLGADAVVTAVFEPEETATLTLQVTPEETPTQGGFVLFNNTERHDEGPFDVALDTWVALTAVPVAGFEFSGWTVEPATGAVLDDQESPVTSVKLSGDTTLTASFTPVEDVETVELAVRATPNTPTTTGGTARYRNAPWPASGGAWVNDGMPHAVELDRWYEIDAESAWGFEFAGWEIPAAGVIIEDPLAMNTSIKLSDNAAVTATFVRSDGFEVTIITDPMTTNPDEPAGNAVIQIDGAWEDEAVAPPNQWHMIESDAELGFDFAGWSADPPENAAFESTRLASTFVLILGDVTLTAAFEDVGTAELVIEGAPSTQTQGGTAQFSADGGARWQTGGPHDVEIGDWYMVRSTPVVGYAFAGWEADPADAAEFEVLDADETYVRLSGDANLTAQFVLTETAGLTVLVDPEPTPTQQPAAGTAPAAGAVVYRPVEEWEELTAIAGVGWRFTGWSIADSETAEIAQPNLANTEIYLTGDTTVTANFEAVETAVLTIGISPEHQVVTRPGAVGPGVGDFERNIGERVWIGAQPNAGYAFVGWTTEGDADIANPAALETYVVLSGDAEVIAEFEEAETGELSVMITPESTPTRPGGTVTPFAAQEDPHTVPLDEWLLVTATPAQGFEFVGWTSSGLELEETASAETAVRLTGPAATLTAEFEMKPKAMLAMAVDSDATPVQSAGTAQFNAGSGTGRTEWVYEGEAFVDDCYDVKAEAHEGFSFVEWVVTSGMASVLDPASERTLASISEATTLTAVFESTDTALLTMAVTPMGSGGTSPEEDESHLVTVGERVWVTADPFGGFRFVEWTGGENVQIQDPMSWATFVVLQDDDTVTAVFEEQERAEITYRFDPEFGAGTIDGPGNPPLEERHWIRANPAAGYTFTQWRVTGDAEVEHASAIGTYLTATGNAHVIAEVAAVETASLTLAVTPPDGGDAEIEPDRGVGTYTLGTGQWLAIEATPEDDYRFVGWEATGGVTILDPNSPSTHIYQTGDGTVTAVFEEIDTVDVTVLFEPTKPCSDAVATVDSSLAWPTEVGEAYEVDACSWQEISVVPQPGFRFVDWRVDGDASVRYPDTFYLSPYDVGRMVSGQIFICPQTDTTVTAIFEATQTAMVTMLELENEGGSTSLNGVSVPDGAEVREFNVVVGAWNFIEAMPAAGYRFTGWSVGGDATVYDNDCFEPATYLLATGEATVTALFGPTGSAQLTLDSSPVKGGVLGYGPDWWQADYGPSVTVDTQKWYWLHPEPAEGYEWIGFDVVGDAVTDSFTVSQFAGGDTRHRVMLSGDAAVTALFQRVPTAELTVAADPCCGGDVWYRGGEWGQQADAIGTHTVYAGHSNLVQVEPEPGYRFTGWDVVGNGEVFFLHTHDYSFGIHEYELYHEYYLVAYGDCTFTAQFEPLPQATITMIVEGPGITWPKAGLSKAYVGEEADLQAFPADGAYFMGWQIVRGDGEIFTEWECYTEAELQAYGDVTVVALFGDEEPTLYDATLAVDPNVGVAWTHWQDSPARLFSPDPYRVMHGVEYCLKTPEQSMASSSSSGDQVGAHRFSHWAVRGDAIVADASDPETTVIFRGDATVTAVYDVYGYLKIGVPLGDDYVSVTDVGYLEAGPAGIEAGPAGMASAAVTTQGLFSVVNTPVGVPQKLNYMVYAPYVFLGWEVLGDQVDASVVIDNPNSPITTVTVYGDAIVLARVSEVDAEHPAMQPADDVYDAYPALTWNTTPGTFWYELWLEKEGSWTWSTWVYGTGFAPDGWGFSAGTYHWTIRPWTEETGTGEWAEQATFVLHKLIAPSGDMSLAKRPTFRWNPTVGATWYKLFIQKEGGAGWHKWVQDTSWTPTDWDFEFGSFKWWVLPWSGPATGTGAWSEGMTFSRGVVTPGEPAGTTVESQPTFTWSAVPGASSYQLAIKQEGGWSWETWVDDNMLTLDGWALAIGSYQWWVQARSEDDGTGPWSEGQTFTVEATSGPSGATSEKQPTFAWNAPVGATHFQIAIRREGEGGWDWKSDWQEATTWKPESWDLGYGDYQWWVQTWGEGIGAQWSDGVTFSVGQPAPEGAEGLINETRPTLAWSEVVGATDYQLFIKQEGGWEWKTWLTGNSWTPPDWDFIPGTYTWFVQARNAEDGKSAWSEGTTFTFGRSVLEGPSGTVVETQPLFTWSRVEGAAWYKVYIEQKGGWKWSTWVEYNTHWSPSGWELSLGDYEWWVQPWGETFGTGLWSGGMTFTVPE